MGKLTAGFMTIIGRVEFRERQQRCGRQIDVLPGSGMFAKLVPETMIPDGLGSSV